MPFRHPHTLFQYVINSLPTKHFIHDTGNTSSIKNVQKWRNTLYININMEFILIHIYVDNSGVREYYAFIDRRFGANI